MLIKNEPIGSISVKGDKIDVKWLDGKKKEPCIECKKMTKKRRQGLPECDECQSWEHEKCKSCLFSIPKTTFVTDGFNDMQDHVEYWEMCAMRDHDGNLRDKPDSTDGISTWHVDIKQRKQCFIAK